MTLTEIRKIAQALADTLKVEKNIDTRAGIIDAKRSIGDLLYNDGANFKSRSVFEKQWRESLDAE